jgi:alpha-ketoglutarate-dependent taurine dioxygenase
MQDSLAIVVRETESSILELPPERVRALFERWGAIWCRGFGVSAPDFLAFIRQFSRELIKFNSPDRRAHFGVPEVVSVTGGSQALNFHTEMGHVPHRPEFLSFLCERPAQQGGETLLVDGVALWAALSGPARTVLEKNRLLYVMRTPHAWWAEGRDSLQIERFLRDVPDLAYQVEADGTLVTEWRTSAASKPKFGDALAIASNVFSYVVPGLTVRFEDGSPIPRELEQELTRIAEELAVEVTWSAGDLVFFDNTRWLHGRRAVRGLGRRVQMLLGHLNFG